MTQNITWHAHQLSTDQRAQLKGHQGAVIWFTGFSGSGKSTIANALEQKLHALGVHSYLLDGDNVRHGLNQDLGFSDADRVENIRRVAEVSALFADAGLMVLTAFISPFQTERALVRDKLPAGRFVEVFVDTPLAECERRDPKGLYQRARAGEITQFTGIDSAYEPPSAPEVHLDAGNMSPQECADKIIQVLQSKGLLTP
ncbi:adenylyl-sulfate kinase [Ferrimonas balearica]|uniref:adenylyl-sulfate kinase n=1 Tax=Ferrimonas balearica TaxID=44012 RepID=UPI001C997328|nr:adenylyl-sulfate kinase [Ferrimonas balearica]MBY5990802.1 adenylyl-sulfate kinase [Ferrimonas balearica]